MNLSHEATDRIRRKVEAQHRLGRRALLEAMETEFRDLKARILDSGKRLSVGGADLMRLGAQLAILQGKVDVMLAELRQDETTIRLPVLPETK